MGFPDYAINSHEWSKEKHCEADIPKWEFFELNKKMQIPIHYTEMDFEKDKEFMEEKKNEKSK